MSTHLDLPDGGWAEIREPREVTNRQKREHTNALVELGAKDDKSAKTIIEALDEGEHLTLLFIKDWSYEKPVSVESFMDLPVDVCLAIENATMKPINQVFPEIAERRLGILEDRAEAERKQLGNVTDRTLRELDKARAVVAANSFDADGALDPKSPTIASPS